MAAVAQENSPNTGQNLSTTPHCEFIFENKTKYNNRWVPTEKFSAPHWHAKLSSNLAVLYSEFGPGSANGRRWSD
jgi:hypothetical protein